MGQVDLLHQPDDQHEAERDQCKQQPDDEAVHNVRQNVEHRFPLERRKRSPDGGDREDGLGSGVDRWHLLVGDKLALCRCDVVFYSLRLGPTDNLEMVRVV